MIGVKKRISDHTRVGERDRGGRDALDLPDQRGARKWRLAGAVGEESQGVRMLGGRVDSVGVGGEH
jgi:hypothetical protein